MSNTLKAVTFLKDNPEKRFLKIQDENGNTIGLQKIFIKDIPNENLVNYLKTFLGDSSSDRTLWVEAREIRGITDKKMGSYSLVIETEKKIYQEPAPGPAPQTYQEPVQQQQPQFLGNAVSQGNGMLGMAVNDVMMLQLKAARLEDITEKLVETRKELETIKHERNILDIEARDLKTKLSTAERDKDLALKIAASENKGFFDSPAFEKMMDKAPEMIGSIAAMKAGQMPSFGAESLGVTASNLSQTKQGFVDYLTDDLTDEQVNYLGSICHFLPNELFKNELQGLIKKYHGN